MSLSPARQHRLRVQAEQAAREGGSVRHASGYDLMLLQLAEDRRRLKGVQSTVKKAEIKVELLPKYAAWAEGVLAAGGAQQDDVLMYVMLWRIDAGDYAGALEIGRHALRHGWVMPLGNRNVQTVLAEEMADAAQSAMLAATGFDADLLLQTLELTDGLDMPDQSRARLHKAIGAVLSESNPAYEGCRLQPYQCSAGGRRPKLTTEQWAQIGRLLEAGESRQRIALIFDVGVSTIYRKFPANKINESP
ncbi:TPA: helix-turn-helix domain-containing protein [Escherichia coli]|nr:helix-turn-helix domain-containing protein [Escherichia coli]